MPTMSTSDLLTEYLHLLKTIVDELYVRGYPRLGAVLKPQMRQRTRNAFNEQALGFTKFADFLRCGENHGYISLTRTQGGDLEAHPIGTVAQLRFPIESNKSVSTSENSIPPPPAVAPADSFQPSPKPLRIRADLWNAFNSFVPSWVYNTTTGTAYFAERALRSTDITEGGLIRIPPAGERMSQWMRTFAEMQEDDEKSQLLRAFDSEKPHVPFSAVVRSNPPLLKKWRRFHAERLLEAINGWARANNIQLENVIVPPREIDQRLRTVREPIRPSSLAAERSEQIGQQGTELSNFLEIGSPKLLSTIDALIDELLKLRGALQYNSSKR